MEGGRREGKGSGLGGEGEVAMVDATNKQASKTRGTIKIGTDTVEGDGGGGGGGREGGGEQRGRAAEARSRG